MSPHSKGRARSGSALSPVRLATFLLSLLFIVIVAQPVDSASSGRWVATGLGTSDYLAYSDDGK
jgi:hypothetical protein